MTLGEKQRKFTLYVSLLIQYAYARGFELTFAEAYRTPEQAAANAANGTGTLNSLHISRLAIDLNLFRDGAYLTGTADHKPLGDFWKSLDPLCCWGGDFSKPDGNHYSMSHEGRK